MDICPGLRMREYIESVIEAASRKLRVLNRVRRFLLARVSVSFLQEPGSPVRGALFSSMQWRRTISV